MHPQNGDKNLRGQNRIFIVNIQPHSNAAHELEDLNLIGGLGGRILNDVDFNSTKITSSNGEPPRSLAPMESHRFQILYKMNTSKQV